MEVVYSGLISEHARGEHDDALFIGYKGEWGDEPFAFRFEEDLEEHGRFVTVRYYITDEERTAEQLAENAVKVLAGAADADYTQHYSDITGYLWTDEECEVGGHDLLAELSGSVGKWCHMTVTFHRDPDPSAAGGKPEGRQQKGS